MKNNKTKYYKVGKIVFLLFSVLLLIASCNEEDAQFREFNYPEPSSIGISSSEGYPGVYDTIRGGNFGDLKGAVKVFFGSVKADSIISVVDDMIVVKVPDDAVSGKVSLQVWTHVLDSIGSYNVIPSPEIYTVTSNNVLNSAVAFPGVDVVTITGIRFGTDASKVKVKFNGTLVTINSITDNTIMVTAPEDYLTGYVSVTFGGLKVTTSTVIINPTAAGDITPYFMGNTGVMDAKGGGFVRAAYDGSRWGTLGAPWITNPAGLNKGNGIGGYGREQWNGRDGFICWETWGNTPVVDGTIYQPTSMALPAGSYMITFNYYGEIQTDSSVHLVVAAGGTGIPVLANISSALASVKLYNGTTIGDTKPNFGGEVTLDFNLSTSQVVSIGFLGNLKGRDTKGNYFLGKWIKLVKN